MDEITKIKYEDFAKIDLKTARVAAAERVAGSEKLVKLTVELGQENRQIVAGIGKAYTPEELVGRMIVVVANLEPRELMGLVSEGMLLAASDAEGRPVLLTVGKDIFPGAKIK